MDLVSNINAWIILAFLAALFLFILPAVAVRGALTVRSRLTRSLLVGGGLALTIWLDWALGLWVYLLVHPSRSQLQLLEGNLLLHNLGILPGLAVGVVAALLVWRRAAPIPQAS